MIARVEFRDAAGRLLGHVVQVGQWWEIVTADGRRTTVGTRVEAMLAGAPMADTAEPGETPEPAATELVGLRVLITGWRATADDIDPGSERAPNILRDPGAMRAETLRRCAAELEIAIAGAS